MKKYILINIVTYIIATCDNEEMSVKPKLDVDFIIVI